MIQEPVDQGWNVKILNGRWPHGKRTIRPADVSDGLIDVMFTRKNLLEDVNYSKIVPNHFVIEVNQENYTANYRPIEKQVLEQWNSRLLNHLLITNSRYGRKEYRFGGRVRVEIRPATDLEPWQVRVMSRIDPEGPPKAAPIQANKACLISFPGGQRWLLHSGVVTIGRDASCDIVLDSPTIRETRLISGKHAYLRVGDGRVQLFDGTISGKPSLNGTFVNNLPVTSQGLLLKDGDQIILAALDPNAPIPDTPGVAAFTFTEESS